MNSVAETHNSTSCSSCGHVPSGEAKFCSNCGKSLSPTSGRRRARLDDHIYTQILASSSLKVGMCLTLLGVLRVVEGVKNVRTLGDELLAVNAAGFLLAAALSYLALKETDEARKLQKGKLGDWIFSGSLAFLVAICILLAVEVF
jgi:hypothetical protein